MADGLSSRCRACNNESTRAWRDANPEYVTRTNADRRKALETRCSGCGATHIARRRDAKCDACQAQRDRSYESKPERAAARRNRNHTRRVVRASGRSIGAFTADDESALRAATSLCGMCGCALTDDRWRSTSKHLDHIVPIAIGGAHTRANVRIICQTCNLSRPKNGSDLFVDVTAALATP